MSKRLKLYMGFPSIGTTVTAQNFQIRNLEKQYGDKIEFVWPEKCTFRIMHDFARNEIIKEFLATDCDAIWFLDSDVVPHHNVLDLITEHGDKWEVAGAPYPIFMNGKINFAIYQPLELGARSLKLADLPKSGQAFIGGAATGCLFIKREVFSKIPAPWFEFVYDKDTREMKIGEDLGFCMKLQDLGINTFVDYSLVCKHYKNVDLLDMNNYAIEFANERLKAFDAEVKEQDKGLIAENRGLKQLLVQAGVVKKTTKAGLILAS